MELTGDVMLPVSLQVLQSLLPLPGSREFVSHSLGNYWLLSEYNIFFNMQLLLRK